MNALYSMAAKYVDPLEGSHTVGHIDELSISLTR